MTAWLSGVAVLPAAVVRSPHVESELVAESGDIVPGRPFTVALRLKMQDHWHTYWKNPGDSGAPTTIAWTLPEGFTAGPIQWPTPVQVTLAGLVTYAHEGEIALLTEITPPRDQVPGSSIRIEAAADWLVCERECVPGSATHALDLRVAATAEPDPARAALFAAARMSQPKAGDAAWTTTFSVTEKEIVLRVKPPVAADTASIVAGKVYFYSGLESVVEPGAPQMFAIEQGEIVGRLKRVEVAPVDPETLEGVLAVPGGFAALEGRALAIAATKVASAIGETPGGSGAAGATAAPSTAGFLLTAGLAFLGGLILNLMPCVFPVLGIKILGFVNQAGADRRKVTIHGLVYTAGVLVSFWALAGVIVALRAAGQEVGWGAQLQVPAFVFGLAAVLLVFALSLSGVFEFGLSATSVGGSLQSKSGYSGSFFSGVLATVVSTPCAAPFLAPALGAAFTLPVVESFAVFTLIALGLSLPYLVLSAFPHLVKVLPRPGAWMETFKQGMAFLLYATVVILVWVLAAQVEAFDFLEVLLSLVLVALATWAYGRWVQAGGGKARVRGTVFAGVVAVAALVLGFRAAVPPAPAGAEGETDAIVWREWTPALAGQLQSEGKVVFVDFTARWCLTCQANELAVFSSRAVREAFRDQGVVAVKADWTNRNPEITRALAALGRSAIPVNLIYRPGVPARSSCHRCSPLASFSKRSGARRPGRRPRPEAVGGAAFFRASLANGSGLDSVRAEAAGVFAGKSLATAWAAAASPSTPP